jgi:6-phosphogluconolactonase
VSVDIGISAPPAIHFAHASLAARLEESLMDLEILPDANAVARCAAAFVAADARAAIAARGRFVIAVSGGATPWQMLQALASEEVPWEGFHVVQVDERFAPENDPDRNLTHLRASLLSHAPLCENQIHAMPVNDPDPETGALRYAQVLAEIAGAPPLLDLAHLGLGTDGHTASLVPGDAVLDVTSVDVAPTGIYQGRRRLTLTYPILNRARRILWLVTGGAKAEMLLRLRNGDPGIPAGRISPAQATLFADRDAAARLK